MKKIVLIFFVFINTFLSYSQTWNTTLNGIDSIGTAINMPHVDILKQFNDTLFIGGTFHTVNTTYVGGVFSWNSLNWQIYESGVSSWMIVSAFQKYKNKLYMGGGFNEVDNTPNTESLAVWNGTSWSGFPNKPPMSEIWDFEEFNDTLFVAYGFGDYRCIAAYDGVNWIDDGNLNSNFNQALVVFNNQLYAGGYFGMKRRLGLANWEDMPGEPQGIIMDMEVDTFNNFLYVGGAFGSVGNNLESICTAMWDGFNWNSMGPNLNCDVYANSMAIYRGDLYVGGCFDVLENGLPVNYIARWDGTQWNNLGKGCSSVVDALGVYKDELYVGGHFTYVNDTMRAYGLARWHMPDTSCNYIKPRVQSYTDTFNVNQTAQLYNNNAYADTWQWDFGDTGTSNIKDPSHIYTQTGTYAVSVTVTHGSCSVTATKDIYIDLGSDINETKKKETGFKIYPNPTKGNLKLVINNEQLLNKNIEIIDVNGKVIKSVIASKAKQSLDISILPNGIYFVKIGNGTQRFVKN
jgi:hypothetical protein